MSDIQEWKAALDDKVSDIRVAVEKEIETLQSRIEVGQPKAYRFSAEQFNYYLRRALNTADPSDVPKELLDLADRLDSGEYKYIQLNIT